MLKVHICEDDREQQIRLESYIEDIITIENLKMAKGLVTDNPDFMIEEIKKEKNIGIFFLDIDLNHKLNGMDLARKIREIQPRCHIIFVTTHSEMSYMTFTYKVEAMDFIIKDNLKEIKNRIHQCLVLIGELHAEAIKESNSIYLLKQGERVKEVSYDDILYFEAITGSRKIMLHAKNTILEFSGKLKDIEESVDNRFYRCHRAIIVNKNNIEKIDEIEHMIYLVGGGRCPMSVRLGKGISMLLKE